jgi:hypothetical protein
MTTKIIYYSVLICLIILPLWLIKSKEWKPFITIWEISYSIVFWILLNITIILQWYISIVEQEKISNLTIFFIENFWIDFVFFKAYFLYSITYLGWLYWIIYYYIFNFIKKFILKLKK